MEKDKPDLVLMDFVLEGEMVGIEAANESVPALIFQIIYLTAYTYEKILERASLTGPSVYRQAFRK